MDERQKTQGQTLIELALVLPCFCLGVFMAVQLIWYCHNMIEIQRMAALEIERVSLEHYEQKRQYSLFHSLFGVVTPPRAQFQDPIPSPWRPFRGVSTIREPGRIISVKVLSDLLPGAGFSRVLSRTTQEAAAETLLETPLPKEN